jgi:hypothetical protein
VHVKARNFFSSGFMSAPVINWKAKISCDSILKDYCRPCGHELAANQDSCECYACIVLSFMRREPNTFSHRLRRSGCAATTDNKLNLNVFDQFCEKPQPADADTFYKTAMQVPGALVEQFYQYPLDTQDDFHTRVRQLFTIVSTAPTDAPTASPTLDPTALPTLGPTVDIDLILDHVRVDEKMAMVVTKVPTAKPTRWPTFGRYINQGPSTAPTTAPTYTNYFLASKGACDSPYTFIDTVAECNHAAVSLSLPVTSSATDPSFAQKNRNPFGCYWRMDNAHLWLNLHGNRANANIDRVSVCKLLPSFTPPPTPVAIAWPDDQWTQIFTATVAPTDAPTLAPTVAPTVHVPTFSPTAATNRPTTVPTHHPTDFSCTSLASCYDCINSPSSSCGYCGASGEKGRCLAGTASGSTYEDCDDNWAWNSCAGVG